MPTIVPFKGLRYNRSLVGSLDAVVTPPYDVISPAQQKGYYRRHPFNFIRVVYGLKKSSDTSKKNLYSRARQTFGEWLEQGILQPDPVPAVYPYLQEYRLGRQRLARWGVVALVRLDKSKILPHEHIRTAPKNDRLKLLETLKATLSPIFGLIPDDSKVYERWIKAATKRSQSAGTASQDGVRHKLWKLSDPKLIRDLQKLLAKKELIIADGHHRCAAALEYRQRMLRSKGSDPKAPYNYAMFYLACASQEEPGLLPTHRLIGQANRLEIKKLKSELKSLPRTQVAGSLPSACRRLERLRRRGRIGMGVYLGNGSTRVLQGLRKMPYRMDVEWLHQELLPRWLSNYEVTYTQDLGLGKKTVKKGQAQAMFVMQSPSLKEVMRRARRGERMPGKTTYFYPKPLSGLVEYKF